jgi:PTS system fructose-specific IIC component/PTS system nitrogen regulatory IIA component
MVLGQVFSPKSIIVNLESEDKDEVFEEMVESLLSVQPQINRNAAVDALRERESKMSTGIIHAIAVPHGITDSVKGIVGAVGISHKGIDYDSLDKAPVNLIFMLLISPEEREKHLQVLASISKVLQNSDCVNALLEKKTAQEVYDTLCSFEK